VREGEILIVKLLPVDALPSRSVTIREITPLAHETGDDAVETRALVPEALLTRAELAEVLCCVRSHVCTELEGDTAHVLAAYLHVKEYLGVGHGETGCGVGAGTGEGGVEGHATGGEGQGGTKSSTDHYYWEEGLGEHNYGVGRERRGERGEGKLGMQKFGDCDDIGDLRAVDLFNL
jgi:hypothetical protein